MAMPTDGVADAVSMDLSEKVLRSLQTLNESLVEVRDSVAKITRAARTGTPRRGAAHGGAGGGADVTGNGVAGEGESAASAGRCSDTDQVLESLLRRIIASPGIGGVELDADTNSQLQRVFGDDPLVARLTPKRRGGAADAVGGTGAPPHLALASPPSPAAEARNGLSSADLGAHSALDVVCTPPRARGGDRAGPNWSSIETAVATLRAAPITSPRIRRRFDRLYSAFQRRRESLFRARRAEWLQDLQQRAEQDGVEPPTEHDLPDGLPEEWEHDSDDGFVLVPIAEEEFAALHEAALDEFERESQIAGEARRARRAKRLRRRALRRQSRRARREQRLRERAGADASDEFLRRLYDARYGSDSEREHEAEEAALSAPPSGRDEAGKLLAAAERADISEAPSSAVDSDSVSDSSALDRDEAEGHARHPWEAASARLGPDPLAEGDEETEEVVLLRRGVERRRARRRPKRPFSHPGKRAVVHDTFALPVVYPRNRTGFEEEKDFVPRVGDVIAGRYLVEGVLGEAAFSTAVQCVDTQSARETRVCLKVIKNSKEFVDQSLDEIKLLRYVNACGDADEFGVLRLLNYFYFKEHLFLVCELLCDNLYEHGRFNRKHEREPYFTLPRIRSIAFQCLRALAFVHDLNLVHCDLKPENILIQSFADATVKIIDFGSSCFITDHLTPYIQSRSYRAPEVILGLPYGHKIDIWSLGCILAELLTGRVILQNDSVQTMLARAAGILGEAAPCTVSLLLPPTDRAHPRRVRRPRAAPHPARGQGGAQVLHRAEHRVRGRRGARGGLPRLPQTHHPCRPRADRRPRLSRLPRVSAAVGPQAPAQRQGGAAPSLARAGNGGLPRALARRVHAHGRLRAARQPHGQRRRRGGRAAGAVRLAAGRRHRCVDGGACLRRPRRWQR